MEIYRERETFGYEMMMLLLLSDELTVYTDVTEMEPPARNEARFPSLPRMFCPPFCSAL